MTNKAAKDKAKRILEYLVQLPEDEYLADGCANDTTVDTMICLWVLGFGNADAMAMHLQMQYNISDDQIDKFNDHAYRIEPYLEKWGQARHPERAFDKFIGKYFNV